jgi:cytochrome c-type biogenesis protein CcmH
MRRIASAALIVGVLAASALPIAADDDSGWSYQLAHDVMSPYCPGLTLAECPSPDAGALREWIIEQEKAGVSKDAVEQLLFERFGDGLLQAPRAEGVGLVAYAIPGVGLLLGGVIVARVVRRRSAVGAPAAKSADSPRPPANHAPAVRTDEDLERQIDEEIGD